MSRSSAGGCQGPLGVGWGWDAEHSRGSAGCHSCQAGQCPLRCLLSSPDSGQTEVWRSLQENPAQRCSFSLFPSHCEGPRVPSVGKAVLRSQSASRGQGAALGGGRGGVRGWGGGGRRTWTCSGTAGSRAPGLLAASESGAALKDGRGMPCGHGSESENWRKGARPSGQSPLKPVSSSFPTKLASAT